ncbi:MAG: signal recognition particle-docking protein FtsY, partial [Alphaproteobacteria bacterium]|nr:signal recognition particle-docking protein FtsY [Alphaproteobacteria bacterium]
QNALEQVRVFAETVQITGLVVTKLDGTSRAGILVALAQKHAVPIHAIGIGEGAEDLQDFDAVSFARALVGRE